MTSRIPHAMINNSSILHVSDDDIRKLRDEALQHGDVLQAALCTIALSVGGMSLAAMQEARELCREAIIVAPYADEGGALDNDSEGR